MMSFCGFNLFPVSSLFGTRIAFLMMFQVMNVMSFIPRLFLYPEVANFFGGGGGGGKEDVSPNDTGFSGLHLCLNA